jgi:hypothetical protein
VVFLQEGGDTLAWEEVDFGLVSCKHLQCTRWVLAQDPLHRSEDELEVRQAELLQVSDCGCVSVQRVVFVLRLPGFLSALHFAFRLQS